MEDALPEGAEQAEPAAAPEAQADRQDGVVDQESEDRRHLQEVRVQEAVLEPDYAEVSGGTMEGHGSQGSHAESLRPLDGADSASGRQPARTSAPDVTFREEPAAGQERSLSAERRNEDVGQVQRSLNFMTGLLTSLTERMSRVEQWQSATGSTAGGAASTAMTPVTPSTGMLGWADVDRLNQQLSELQVRADEGGGHFEMNRPLASTARIFQGTFSSDSSETARRRASDGPRGIPGTLLGPLALADRPFILEGDPMQVDHVGDPAAVDATLEQTVESVMKAQASTDGVHGQTDEIGGGASEYHTVHGGYGIIQYLPLGAMQNLEQERLIYGEGGPWSSELGRYVGVDQAQGSPVTVAELIAPRVEPSAGTATTSAQGMVCVQGTWHPYTVVQGQMVVQFGSGGMSPPPAATLWESGGTPPPPPGPPPPGTPKVGTTSGSSSTPGGTPVPPALGEASIPSPPPAPPPVASSIPLVVEAGLSEEPSKLVTKLPVLASARGGDAAVIAGDWLAQLEPSMSSLSSSAASWWKQLMDRVKSLYTTWLESAPVTRLSLRQSILSQRPAQDKHQRVEQRAAVLLLESLPEELRHEVVSVRAVTVEAMIFLVHCAYQPGGAGEKAHLLQFLTAPEVGNGLEGTLQLARKWVRLLRRGRELQLVLPDPSLLCRGLDRVISTTFSGNKHPSATFRIASFKLERQLDYKATLVDAEDYAYLVVGELEAALLAQPLPAPPKVARLEETRNQDDAGKGKGKAKQQRPCWGWQDGSGCKYGSRCMFAHAALGPGRCWECGSDSHLKPQCPILGQGGNASGGGGGQNQNASSSTGKGGGSGGAAATSSSAAATTSSSNGGGDDKPPKGRRKKGGGKDKGAKQEAVRKTEEEATPELPSNAPLSSAAEDSAARSEFFEEATKALKSLRLAKVTEESLANLDSSRGGKALVDSGATTSMRTAQPGEVEGLPRRKVLLAEGETWFYQLPGGTLLTTRTVAPIVAMSDLMEIGCRVMWNGEVGCQITHPSRGALHVRVVNGCPEINEALGLDLIQEAEEVKERRRNAEIAVNRLVEVWGQAPMLDWELGKKAVKDLRNGVGLSWAWLHRAFPEAPAWLVSAVPTTAGAKGDQVPWNRHERKRWKQASAVAVHLFCGKDRATWASRAEAAHVVLVDQAEDLMADGTYAALLDLALTGKIKMVFGGPPCRTFSALRNVAMEGQDGPRPLRDRNGDGRWGRKDLSEWEEWRARQDVIMIFRMLFLWMVAAAVAQLNGDRDPDFLLEHPEDPKVVLEQPNYASLWAFPEIHFLAQEMGWTFWEFDQGPLGHPRRKPTRIIASKECPRELRGLRGPSTLTEEERDHDGAGFRSSTWAAWAPGLKQAVKWAVEESLGGSVLESVMKLDHSFLEHLRRDHTPFRRDCRACLAGSFRGHAHRRVVAPEAWCLSLDVVGPTRQGCDEYVKKVRYALVGTLAVPDVLGKLLQPPEPGADDGGGVGPMGDEDPVCEDGYMADEEAEPSAPLEEERSKREMEKWMARVNKDKLEGVTCVEVPFVVTMASKAANEVLAATKDILVQVKKLGLVVQRVHTDRRREFIGKSFRALCRDRGLVRTTTTGDDFKANGRVEALVGRAKNAVRTYLSGSGMGPEMWGFAMRHYMSKIQQEIVTRLGGRLPRIPPFGTKVFVKQRSWRLKKEEFMEKVVAARILCPSMDVARGFLVRTDDGTYLTTMVAVENVKEISGEFEVDGAPRPSGEPGARRRIYGKTPIVASLQREDSVDAVSKMTAEEEEGLRADEEIARKFLEAGDFSMDAADELLESLSLGEVYSHNRRPGTYENDSDKVSVHVLGMFRHGGVVGATLGARRRPFLTQFLTKVVRTHAPSGTTFTTLSINYNTQLRLHRDGNNQTGAKAYLMGFGNYVGGGLWCRDEKAASAAVWKKFNGKWLSGYAYPTYHKVVQFDPCRLHQPLPWTGRRISLSAYTVGCVGNCANDGRDLLQRLGFPLPSPQALSPEGGGVLKVAVVAKEEDKNSSSSFQRLGDGQEPGEHQTLESHRVCGGDGQEPGEHQTLESPRVCGGDGQEPGEHQTLESRRVCVGDGPVGFSCICKGYEVDPSLCVCRSALVAGQKGPEEFFIGEESSDGEAMEPKGAEWIREDWGAYSPPQVPWMKALGEQDETVYQIVGSEVPLEVGWDLFDEYLDNLRLALVQEEHEEREDLIHHGECGRHYEGPLSQRVASRVRLEQILAEFVPEDEAGGCEHLFKAEAVPEEAEVPLHTKTVANEVVRREIDKWVPSMLSEYESLVRENEAVEPFPVEKLEQWKKEGKDFDLVPGKTVHTVKAFTGRLKTRAVICGNFLGQTFSKDQKYAAGADGVLIRVVLRMVALMAWTIGVMDVRTAFLLAPLLFQEERPTLVQVPKMFLLGGVCKETMWRVKRALYGMVTSPRSWEVYRNKTMAQMRGKVSGDEVRFIPSEVDGSLWYIMAGERRAGVIVCYVDDLLIAGEPLVAKEAAQMVARTWKCTEPQWDDVTFNGFEILRSETGLVLKQDSYTKDLLARYKDLEGYEDVPAPVQLAPEDFVLKENEVAADFVRAAQTMAGELQWLAGRCRPEILYAVNLLSQAISKNPKEAVYRGGHLLKYLKRYPEGGIHYTCDRQLTPDTRVQAAGIVVEGFCDASFAPNSGRSQQSIMIFLLGGLVAWTSSRQAFITMSTAESELVAICELATCLKSVEHLVAEVMAGDKMKATEVFKAIHSDSQAALAVCGTAAGSWRTRHLRIRGSLVRELLEQADWTAHHTEGHVMLADLGTKALAADRFAFLTEKMRVVRKRHHDTKEPANKPARVKKLMLLLCLASLVEQADGAAMTEQAPQDAFDYQFLVVCMVAVVAIWEQRSPEGTRLVEEPRVQWTQTHLGTPLWKLQGCVNEREGSDLLLPPVPEPVYETWWATRTQTFAPPRGRRDYWEVDEDRCVAIRYHPTARLNLFVPGQAAGGPPLSRFTGERRTVGRLASGQTIAHLDNFAQLSKPAQLLANKEWTGVTELRLKSGG
ncbi:Copia protein [Symbiodinium microadriaticum]|uniref:Copia protein n=1 Tax=Symbiodinium microadriaticum TaxID=2951 RepID=A0A1Q9F7F3_SYMMI|nr:Copia protein [Symbiodinium microadriaticum]